MGGAVVAEIRRIFAAEDADFTLEHDGTVYVLEAENTEALKYLRDEAITEAWQWETEDRLVVDQHYVGGLVAALQEEGFKVERV